MNDHENDIYDLKKEMEKMNSDISSLKTNEENNNFSKNKSKYDDSDRAKEAYTRAKESINKSDERSKKEKNKNDQNATNTKFLKQQITTNEYLSRLLSLSEKNKKERESKDNQKKVKNNLNFAHKLSSGSESDNPLIGLIGSFSKTAIASKNTLKGIENFAKKVGNFVLPNSSTNRTKKINKTVSKINKDKTLLSAYQYKINDLEKDNGSHYRISTLQHKMNTIMQDLNKNADNLGITVAKETLRQKKKENNNFKFNKNDQKLINEQLQHNIAASVMQDIYNFNKERKPSYQKNNSAKKSNNKSNYKEKKQQSNQKNNFEFVTNSKLYRNNDFESLRHSNIDTYKTINAPQSKLYRNNDFESLRHSNIDTYKTINAPQSILNKSILTQKIHRTSTPSTYGEYVAGIYYQLQQLNKKKNRNNNQNKFSNTNKPTNTPNVPPIIPVSGGIVKSLITKVLPAVAGAAVGVFGTMKAQQWFKNKGIGDGTAGGNPTDDLIIKGTKNVTSVGANVVGKKLITNATKSVAKKTLGKLAVKSGEKIVGKTLARFIPGASLGMGGYLAYQRFKKGDKLGGIGELASGIAGTVPIVGPAISAAIDLGLAGRDVYKATGKNKNVGNFIGHLPLVGTFTNFDKAISNFKKGNVKSGLGNLGNNILANNPFTAAISMGLGLKSVKSLNNDTRSNTIVSNRANNNMKLGTPTLVSKSSPVTNALPSMNSLDTTNSTSQLEAMQLQAKLIAQELFNIQQNPIYLNQQRDAIKANGRAFASALEE